MVYFKDNVNVHSQKYRIETDTLHFNSKSKIAFFLGPSYIFSKNNTIYCENGWYNTDTDKSQFNKNAYIADQKFIIQGDSLFYNRNKGYGKAIDNVKKGLVHQAYAFCDSSKKILKKQKTNSKKVVNTIDSIENLIKDFESGKISKKEFDKKKKELIGN